MPAEAAPILEQIARDEYREGVSPGAAMRQLCRMLGISGEYPTLQRLLEDVLADHNRASHDRNCILTDFAEVDAEAAKEAKMASFRRLNRMDEEPQARH